MAVELINWQFRQISNHAESPLIPNQWYDTKNFTSHQIHTDLLEANIIPDPFIDDNEIYVQWISELNWQYRCIFDAPGNSNSNASLILEGIDTFANIKLNNKTILTTDNYFHKHVIPIIMNDNNELVITFNSSLRIGQELEQEHGKLPVWNGDSSRVYVRKPQFQYGWDWGPNLNTCGFESIKLITDEDYVKDFFIGYNLNQELDIAELSIEIEYLFDKSPENIEIEIKDDTGIVVDRIVPTIPVTNYNITNVKLWYPINQGKQLLYQFSLIINGICKTTQKVGFRKIELVQVNDKYGKSFYFKINNIPIQIWGTNWIPAHSFQSQLTKLDYQQWINLIIHGGYNLIRIWGGGQYEKDILYSLCDEAGILIWQDFMFACGIYPETIIESVTQEVEDQLIRLRQHCSIIIYAGNNEDYQIAELINLDTNNSTQFPAKNIYEYIIPDKINKLCNFTPYHYGSPYSDTSHKSSDPTIGDLHQWNVWHGTHEPYQNWPELSGRFVSEFGMLSIPSLQTLTKYINESQLSINSTLLNFHTKAAGGIENLDNYLWDNFLKPESLDISHYIYLTQLLQSEAMSLAYRYWRRNWENYKTGGIIMWQLNDCWPSISWSAIDFLKIPKLVYYGVKREIQQVGIACRRYQIKQQTYKQQNVFEVKNCLDIWGFGEFLDIGVKIEFYTEYGDLYFSKSIKNLVFLNNQVNMVAEKLCFDNINDNTIIYLKLIENDKIIARSSDWPQPLKKLPWNKLSTNLTIEYLGQGDFQISTTKPVKRLELYFDYTHNYLFDDNGIDLFPDDPQIIHINNFDELDVEKLRYRHLGSI